MSKRKHGRPSPRLADLRALLVEQRNVRHAQRGLMGSLVQVQRFMVDPDLAALHKLMQSKVGQTTVWARSASLAYAFMRNRTLDEAVSPRTRIPLFAGTIHVVMTHCGVEGITLRHVDTWLKERTLRRRDIVHQEVVE